MARDGYFAFAIVSIAWFAPSAVFSQTKPKAADFDALVKQLQSDRVDDREAAAEMILRLGEEIRPWIVQGLQCPSLEARLRCKQLIKRIDAESLARRVQKFRETGQPRDASDLPCWEDFRTLFGDSVKARELYCDMVLSEHALLEQLSQFKVAKMETAVATSPAAVQARLSVKARPILTLLESISLQSIGSKFSHRPESISACVLIASDPDLKNHKAISQTVFGYFRNPTSLAALKKSRHFPIVRVGVAQWLAESPGKILPLEIALRLGLAELALPLGRKAVSNYAKVESDLIDESSQAAVLGIIACGRFGDESDIDRLAPLLDKEIVVQTWLTTEQEIATGQLRDFAIAFSAHLAQVDAKSLGFKHLESRADTVFAPYTVTFVDEAERAAAHANWLRHRRTSTKKSAKPTATTGG